MVGGLLIDEWRSLCGSANKFMISALVVEFTLSVFISVCVEKKEQSCVTIHAQSRTLQARFCEVLSCMELTVEVACPAACMLRAPVCA